PVPAPIHDRGGPDPADLFETVSRESHRKRGARARAGAAEVPESRLESTEISLRSADMIPLGDIGVSQPAIHLDPEDIQPVDDAGRFRAAGRADRAARLRAAGRAVEARRLRAAGRAAEARRLRAAGRAVEARRVRAAGRAVEARRVRAAGRAVEARRVRAAGR